EPRSMWRNTGVLASDYTYITVCRQPVKGWRPKACRASAAGLSGTVPACPSLTLRVSVPGMKYEPLLHVVLYQPEIPPNTGNIGRSCVAVGAKLWLIKPIGFQIDEKQLRRAGL